MAGRETQHAVDQFEANAPQHAFAEAALVGVDIKLEQTVDDDKQQEHQAERHQHLKAGELEPVEEHHLAEIGNIVLEIA